MVQLIYIITLLSKTCREFVAFCVFWSCLSVCSLRMHVKTWAQFIIKYMQNSVQNEG